MWNEHCLLSPISVRGTIATFSMEWAVTRVVYLGLSSMATWKARQLEEGGRVRDLLGKGGSVLMCVFCSPALISVATIWTICFCFHPVIIQVKSLSPFPLVSFMNTTTSLYFLFFLLLSYHLSFKNFFWLLFILHIKFKIQILVFKQFHPKYISLQIISLTSVVLWGCSCRVVSYGLGNTWGF